MDQSAVRPFYLVTKRDMEDAAAKGGEAVVVISQIMNENTSGRSSP